MTIDLLPPSPSGEISHGEARLKINEIATEVNEPKITPSEYIIDSQARLPNVSNGVSTLEPNVNYKFSNDLTLTDIDLVVSEGTMLSGDGVFGSGVAFTSDGNIISSSNVGFTIENLAVTAPNCNQVLDCSGTGVNSLFADKFRIYDSEKLGTFSGMAQVFNNFVANRFNSGFSYTGGPIIGFSIVNAFMQDIVGADFFDFDDAVFYQAALRSVEMAGVSGSNYFVSSVGGANLFPGTDAVVNGCTFGLTGQGMPLTGFDDGFQTIGWSFSGNSPLAVVDDTHENADMFLLDQNTITVSASGEWYEIGTPLVGAWLGDLANRFELNSSGYLVYTGEDTVDVKITHVATVDKVGGGSDELEGRIAISWTGSPTDGGLGKSKASTRNNQPTSITMVAQTTISTGDTIRPIFSNKDSSSNIEVLSSVTNVWRR